LSSWLGLRQRLVPGSGPGQQRWVGEHVGSHTGPPQCGATQSHVSGTHFVMHASCGGAPELGEPGGAAACGVGTASGSPKVQIFSPGGQIKGSH
jgi:hypothetical protein